MNTLNREDADEFARWFQCLADGTRLLILHTVARADAPMLVGEIVEAVGKSQSTVSRHLRVLADERFVFMQPDGVRTLVSINDLCMRQLPEAAALIMANREFPTP